MGNGLRPGSIRDKAGKAEKMIKEDLRKTLKQYEKVIPIYEKLNAKKAERILSETLGREHHGKD